jgi:RNA polymerase sigma-70 factor (ECF subfamily)
VSRRRSGAEPRGEGPDPALVERARAGAPGAFDELVRVTYADTYTLALRLTGDEHDARDVVQDAYLRAYRAIGRFRGEAAFTTWLYRITANCAASALARRGRADQALDTLSPPDVEAHLREPSDEHDPEARSLRRSERDRLSAALAELPDGLRAVVVLRDVYELPHEAIAGALGISRGAAKVRLHRGRRQLRDRLFAVAPAGAAVDQGPAARSAPPGTAGTSRSATGDGERRRVG